MKPPIKYSHLNSEEAHQSPADTDLIRRVNVNQIILMIY